jgi:hypothetical protein
MRKHLLSDERGAIMLVALAFAVFGVAMLYYAIGIGETVLQREHMQDAADGAALTAAVVHARSMNFIVLLNIIMAALIAILVAFKLAETLALIGIIVAAALAWFTGGASLSAIPPLKGVAGEMKDLYDTCKDPIFTALEVLHDTAGVVAAVSPGAADGVASADIKAHWAPPVDQYLVAKNLNALPVEDDTFDKLCNEGGKLAGGLALEPLVFIPGGIKDALSDALGDLTGSMSDWFCGESGGPTPSPPARRETKLFPRTEEMERCQHETLSPSQAALAAQDPEHFHTPACDESSADVDAAKPDSSTGACRSGQDCSESGPYEQHAEMARQQCDPTTSPAPFGYTYQTRSATVSYRYNSKAGWVRGTPEYKQPALVADQATPPCGPQALRPSVGVGYQKQVRAKRGGEVQPLCSDEAAPVLPPLGPNDPREVTVEFVEVRHMLSCKKSVLEPIEVSNSKAADDSGDPKYPKRVRGDLKLGGEVFQIRTVVHKSDAATAANKAVKLSLWGAKAPEVAHPPGYGLAPFAFAQAEYFYDGTEGPDAWMWNMNWRARLRRFRLAEDVEDRRIFFAKTAVPFTTQDSLEFQKDLLAVEAEIAH